MFIQCVTGGWGRGPQTDKHLPPSTFTGQLLRKAEFRVWCHYGYLAHALPAHNLPLPLPQQKNFDDESYIQHMFIVYVTKHQYVPQSVLNRGPGSHGRRLIYVFSSSPPPLPSASCLCV